MGGDRWIGIGDVVSLMEALHYRVASTRNEIMTFQSETEPADIIPLDVRRVEIELDDLCEVLISHGIPNDLVAAEIANLGLDR